MPDQPTFTVAITAWGRPELLPRVLLDVLDQGHDAWDGFVIGDGPVPEHRAVFDEFRAGCPDPRLARFRFVERPRREGIWGNHLRRWALENAGGDYCVILGHDARLSRDYLSRHAENARNHPGCLSLVDVHNWTSRRMGTPSEALPYPQYLGVWPGARNPGELKIAEVDLTCMAFPLPLAADVGCFDRADEWHYPADYLAYRKLLAATAVVHLPGACAAHF